jgi:hypothetical protein
MQPLYLYGASVQGIQSFIFETNKLQEIAGASELVEEVATHLFRRYCNEISGVSIIVGAAGNARAKGNREAIARMYRDFPAQVAQMAPGITISQAVVPMAGSAATRAEMNELEERLKVARSSPAAPLGVLVGTTASLRYPRTGRPCVTSLNLDGVETALDAATAAKRETSEDADRGLARKLNLKHGRLPFDFSELTGVREGAWLAVVHIDGNNLGKLIQARFSGDNAEKDYHDFSEQLSKCTVNACKEAWQVLEPYNPRDRYPARPLVLGGDDLTLVIRADLALAFVDAYLLAFEGECARELQFKLTAAAGVALVKDSFPFFQAHRLAEALCARAKSVSRDVSTVAFHRLSSSFVGDFSDVQSRELRAGSTELFFGPYESGVEVSRLPALRALMQACELIVRPEASALASGLREWLTLLHDEPAQAISHLRRLRTMVDEKSPNVAREFAQKLAQIDSQLKWSEGTLVVGGRTPIADIINLAAVSGNKKSRVAVHSRNEASAEQRA